MSGLFLVAPVIASVAIPAQARVLLTLSLSLVIYPTLPAVQQQPIALDLFTLALGAMMEVFIGFTIGLLALLPLTAMQLGGLFIGQQLGFGLAQISNPALETDSDILGELLIYVALGVFLAFGGVDLMFLALCKTFAHIPLGGYSPASAPLSLLLGVLGSSFDVALRVTLPVLGILLMETIATAFISRTLPQFGITSIGFGIKIILGLIAIIAGLRAMEDTASDFIRTSLEQLLTWSIGPIGPAGPSGGAH